MLSVGIHLLCFSCHPLAFLACAVVQALHSRRLSRQCATAAAPEGKSDTPQGDQPVKYNTEFGYSRKDVTLICVGLTVLGYVLYYGLQAGGMDAGMAGNWVQLAIFVGICVGWVSTYLFRVATKASDCTCSLQAASYISFFWGKKFLQV